MPTFKQRLRELRQSKDLSQQKLADIIDMSKSSINMYERGEREPSLETLEAFADCFNVDIDYLLGKSNIPNKTLSYLCEQNKDKGIKIPVLGKVQAGIPVEAIEDIIDYEEIPTSMAKQGEFFALQIRGDSMMPRMVEGDVIIVRKQSDVMNGDIAVVLVNGYDATVKKVKKSTAGITLIPLNTAFDPIYYSNNEIESLPVTVLGKVVELRGKF